jgi:hypothetical protein
MYMVRSVCCGALLIKYLFSRASGLLSVCATVVLERKSFAFIVLFIALSSQCFRSAINIDVCLTGLVAAGAAVVFLLSKLNPPCRAVKAARHEYLN